MSELIRDFATGFHLLKQDTQIALDIETTGLNPWGDKTAVISLFGATTRQPVVLHVLYESWDPVILDRPDVTWVTHNGTGFDLLFLRQHGMHIQKHYDTLVGEQVLTTQNRHDVRRNLGATMKRRIGHDFKLHIDHSTWQRPHLTDEQLEYCINDVKYLHEIKTEQEALAATRGMTVAMNREQELTRIIVDIENIGMHLSQKVYREMYAHAVAQAAKAQQRLHAQFGKAFKANSAPQVKAALKTINIEAANTTAATLGSIPRRLAQDILIVRKAGRRTGMYSEDWMDKYVDDNNRVHSRYWQLGTETTRFSSSGPNLQQIPRNWRRMFGNEDGLKVVSVDYAQIELRIAAMLSRDADLVEALHSEDFHSEMAKVSFAKELVNSIERRGGKAGTFTWIFCGGVEGMLTMDATNRVDAQLLRAYENPDDTADELELEPQMKALLAGDILSRLRSRFKGVTRWHNNAKAQVQTRRQVITIPLPWGHVRHLVGYDRTAGRIVNTQVQGTASIGLKEALFIMDARGLTEYTGGLIHDETVATSVPEADAYEYGEEVRKAMIEGMEVVCATIPILCDVDVTDEWRP